MGSGIPLRCLPEIARSHHLGTWGDVMDTKLHLEAWYRVLDREAPDYAN